MAAFTGAAKIVNIVHRLRDTNFYLHDCLKLGYTYINRNWSSTMKPAINTAQTDAKRYFPILKLLRKKLKLTEIPFSTTGDAVVIDVFSSRVLALKLSQTLPKPVKAGDVYGSALLHEIAHLLCKYYIKSIYPEAFKETAEAAARALSPAEFKTIITAYTDAFPPPEVFSETVTPEAWSKTPANAMLMLEELLLIRIANENPALTALHPVFSDAELRAQYPVDKLIAISEKAFTLMPALEVPGQKPMDLLSMLREPARRFPNSIKDQLAYILSAWKPLLGDILAKLLGVLDLIAEEEKPRFGGGPGPSQVLTFEGTEHEYEAFTSDSDWMPKVVMIAKSTLVWLDQLSKKYQRAITTLDAIPDEELEILARRGFNALWLIGLWERSHASQRIKQLCGNPEAAASAYALWDYEIAGELGGWPALENLRWRAWKFGIRLAADMVPNHTGIDSSWVRYRPDLFMQRTSLPFPTYTFNGENLSGDPSIGIWLEDHYYNRSDCAVVFKRVDFRTGDTRYIYHGNDGTSMPWNDTAQIDFLKPEARQAVIERILHVARNFPIIRFDAAMIMAKRHFRRLWYPEPGHGGDIPSRSEYALSRSDFDRAMPNEFWREVVDICAQEVPDTLLLAEAFWMMEGYFVRTLGMHRVYNSAFMNMLKRKENQKYRDTIKNTQEFDKEILKRFVNFMNNPDEETAVAQFGKGDHYFGVCTLMATLPGLPMFGHGQIEGFTEKYGMEYRRAYYDETADEHLIARHEREIFPLLKKRYLFSGVDNFVLYDLWKEDSTVDENVFAFSNGTDRELALVLYNNEWTATHGTINWSCQWAQKHPDGSKTMARTNLGGALRLPENDSAFLIMQEQRSGLWYIRNALEIHRHGLKVMLNGFESQVFLNIHTVIDDARELYKTLTQRLNGSGTLSISDSLLDIEFQSFYSAWDTAFRSTDIALDEEIRLTRIAEAFDELIRALRYSTGNSDITSDAFKLAKQTIEAAAHMQAIHKAILKKQDSSKKTDKSKITIAAATASVPYSLELYCECYPDILVLALQYPVARACMNLCYTWAQSLCADSGTSHAPKTITGLIASETVLAPDRAQQDLLLIQKTLELWNRLGLTRKLAQTLPVNTAKELTNTLVSLSLLEVFAKNKGYIPFQEAVTNTINTVLVQAIKTFADTCQEFREAIGLHSWDETLWFNKERSEQFAALLALLYASALSNTLQAPEAIKHAEAYYFQPLQNALETSGWHWEKLLANLETFLEKFGRCS